MPDQRELYEDPEEAIRSAWAGIRTHMQTAMPAILESDSPDGHTARLVLAVKRAVEDRVQDKVTYQEFPVLADVPIHYPGAGGITHTFALKAKDEAVALFSSRSIDAWHQSGGTQQPIFNRLHSLSDAMVIPGLRSDPRKLHQISNESAQARDDAKHHVDDHSPTSGFKRKTVDPTTAPASASFDPFKDAVKFFEHLIHPTAGHAHNATDGETTHSITNTHADGPKMSALNGAHSVAAHPEKGVSIASTIAHLISAPNASLDESGNMSVKGNNSAAGAVSGMSGSFTNGISLGEGGSGGSMTSTGLSGDVTGTFDESKVVSLAHVVQMQGLPQCATDAAAAAAGVAIGALYLSTAVTITTTSSAGSSGGSSSTTTTIPAGLLRVRLA